MSRCTLGRAAQCIPALLKPGVRDSERRSFSWVRKPIDIDVPLGVVIDADEFIASFELAFWARLAKLSWRPFEEAREFVHRLGFKNEAGWRKYRRGEMPEKGTKPDDVPTNPNYAYKDQGWMGWGDWLGKGTVAPRL